MANKREYLEQKKVYLQNKIEYCKSVGRDTEYHDNKLAYIESRLEAMTEVEANV